MFYAKLDESSPKQTPQMSWSTELAGAACIFELIAALLLLTVSWVLTMQCTQSASHPQERVTPRSAPTIMVVTRLTCTIFWPNYQSLIKLAPFRAWIEKKLFLSINQKKVFTDIQVHTHTYIWQLFFCNMFFVCLPTSSVFTENGRKRFFFFLHPSLDGKVWRYEVYLIVKL